MTFATISRTARILGFKSRSTLYSWIDKGYLDDFLYEDAKQNLERVQEEKSILLKLNGNKNCPECVEVSCIIDLKFK